VGAGTVCAGWSDLYYVPMRLAAAFGDLMHLYFWQRVFHEVAVPSILHILSGGSREEEVLDGCFGCCCCDLEPAIDPALVLGKQECAHRVDLRALAALCEPRSSAPSQRPSVFRIASPGPPG